jgi:hypothetical protein
MRTNVQRVFERSDITFSRRASQSSIDSSVAGRDDVTRSTSSISTLDTNRLFDLCFSPTSTGRFINIEEIELFLNQQNLLVREMTHLMEDQRFQRWTLQFVTDNGKHILICSPNILFHSC